MPIDYETQIPDNKVGDSVAGELLEFTRLILKEAAHIGSRFHTIESDPDPVDGERTDRIYIRDAKPSGNRCYLFVQIVDGIDNARVGFGELQHSGGEPTWGERNYSQSVESARVIVAEIQHVLR